jgi:Protein of unknown function (DUF2972)
MFASNDTRFRVLLDEFHDFAVTSEIVASEVLEMQRECASGTIPDGSCEKAKYLFGSEKERRYSLLSLCEQLIPKIKKKTSAKTIERLLLSLIAGHDEIILNLVNLYTGLIAIQIARRLEDAGNLYGNSLDESKKEISILERVEESKSWLQALNNEINYLSQVEDSIGEKYINKLDSIREFLHERRFSIEEIIEYIYETEALCRLSKAIIGEHLVSFEDILKSNILPLETSILEKHSTQQQMIAKNTDALIQKINDLKSQFKNEQTLQSVDTIISEINNATEKYRVDTDTRKLSSDMKRILGDLTEDPKFMIEIARIDLENKYNNS